MRAQLHFLLGADSIFDHLFYALIARVAIRFKIKFWSNKFIFLVVLIIQGFIIIFHEI